MRPVKHKIYTDSDFPDYVFINTGKGTFVYRNIHTSEMRSRKINHYYLIDKQGKRKAISEQRIEAAMELQRDVLDVRYVPKNKSYRVKSNAYFVALLKAGNELKAEHPNAEFSQYLDDAFIKIMEIGYIPTDFDDIKSILIKQCLAVKIEKQKGTTTFEKVAYKVASEKGEFDTD